GLHVAFQRVRLCCWVASRLKSERCRCGRQRRRSNAGLSLKRRWLPNVRSIDGAASARKSCFHARELVSAPRSAWTSTTLTVGRSFLVTQEHSPLLKQHVIDHIKPAKKPWMIAHSTEWLLV